MIVLPSDHLIKYNKMFTNILSDGCDFAEKGPNLVTIGITSDYPETYQGLRKIQKVIGTRQQEKKLIATVGIENLIVVDTEDATLICDKNSVGDIEKVLENLKICNRDEYI